jgi:hypothetical protein
MTLLERQASYNRNCFELPTKFRLLLSGATRSLFSFPCTILTSQNRYVVLFIAMLYTNRLVKIPPDTKMYLVPSKVPEYQTLYYPFSCPQPPPTPHSANPKTPSVNAKTTKMKSRGRGKVPNDHRRVGRRISPNARISGILDHRFRVPRVR